MCFREQRGLELGEPEYTSVTPSDYLAGEPDSEIVKALEQ
jgi:hypothetical protein